MKDVLTVKKADSKKLFVGSRIANVKTSEPTSISDTEMLLPVDFRTPAQLFAMGWAARGASGSEFDAELEARKAKAAAKA